MLVVQASGGFRGGARASTAASVSLTKQDAEALQNPSLAPDVKSASPVVDASDVKLVYGGTSYEPSSFVGTTPSYLTAHSYKLAEGASFTAEDVTKHRRVAVIGQTVVQELFAGAERRRPEHQGQRQQLRSRRRARQKGHQRRDQRGRRRDGPDHDRAGLAHRRRADRLDHRRRRSPNPRSTPPKPRSRTILEERHKIKDTAEPGFSVLNQGSLLETSSSTSSVFTTLLGEVAAISLLVGGIGVMNIMLVSASPSARARSASARRSAPDARDILTQFLTEAVLVSLFGGLAGVVVGVIGSQFEIAGVHPEIATYSIFLAFGAALASGLFFGTYPAARAARLRPIEALRFE